MNVAPRPLAGISLFSGVGMLDEGLRAGLAYLGIAYRAICHVEREAHAAAIMVARMEEGSMDAAPVWPDVCTFDAHAWRGKVDCVVAGFPCQDLSVAGRRAGLDGQRSGLFFEVVRIADDCGARFLFLENVGGIASATASVVDEAEGDLEERAAARVVGELADLGWNAEWLHLSASDVGASHGRERWFCFAWRMADAELPERREIGVGGTGREQGHDGERRETHGGVGVAGSSLADTASSRCGRGQDAGSSCGHASERSRRVEPQRGCSVLADACRDRRERGEECDIRPLESGQQASRRHDVKRCDPDVADTDGCGFARIGGSGQGGTAEQGNELGDANGSDAQGGELR